MFQWQFFENMNSCCIKDDDIQSIQWNRINEKFSFDAKHKSFPLILFCKTIVKNNFADCFWCWLKVANTIVWWNALKWLRRTMTFNVLNIYCLCLDALWFVDGRENMNTIHCIVMTKGHSDEKPKTERSNKIHLCFHQHKTILCKKIWKLLHNEWLLHSIYLMVDTNSCLV